MPINEAYRRQVRLLMRLLPLVAREDCFALKGGTAINLFVRDLVARQPVCPGATTTLAGSWPMGLA